MNKPKTTPAPAYNKVQTWHHQVGAKFAFCLAPTLAWLIKDLPCAACSQPAPLVRQNPQNHNHKGLPVQVDKLASPQDRFLPNILLCPSCAAALAPRMEGYCQFCALPFPKGSQGFGPCSACVQQKPNWQNIYFLAAYEGLLQRLLLHLKFENGLYAANILGKFLAKRIQNTLCSQKIQNTLTSDPQEVLLASPVASPVANPVASPVASPLANPVPSPFASPLASPFANPAGCSASYGVDDFGASSGADSGFGAVSDFVFNAGSAASSAQNFNNFSCVIPVPLSSQRLKERGYNQSLEIARVVAKELDLPLDYKHLLRIKHGIPQERLNKKERFKAVQGMFAVCNQQSVSKRHVLLLDDIMTTGATIQECTRVLLAAGATAVSVAVVARTGLE